MEEAVNVPTKEDFRQYGAPHLVYIRPTTRVELMRSGWRIPDADTDIFYAIHEADGRRIGVMNNRATAFAQSYLHDLNPVSVH